MIDLHHHLLPGIDDGPATPSETLAAAERAAHDGVRTIAATPHVREDHPCVRPSELAERSQEVADGLARSGVPISVVVGGEVDLSWAQAASDEALRLVSYAQRGTDLLVETPYGHLPSTFESLLFELQVRGYRILLAHPERNPTLQSDLARLEALVRRGILVQLSGEAIVPRGSGSRSAALAVELLERGLAHVIASDAHGANPRRAPLSKAVAAAKKRIGDAATDMVTTTPAAILAGDPISTAEEPRRPRRGRLRRRLRGP